MKLAYEYGIYWLPFGRIVIGATYGARARLAGPNTWRDPRTPAPGVRLWTGYMLLMSRRAKVRPIKHWDADIRYAARKAAARRAPVSPFERGKAHRTAYYLTPAQDFEMTPDEGIAWMTAEDDADGAPEQIYTLEDGAAFVAGVLS